MRFVSLKSLAYKIADNTSIDVDHNVEYILHPVEIKRKIQENFLPPSNLADYNARFKFKEMRATKSAIELNPKPVKPEVGGQFRPKRPSTVEPSDPQKLQELARKPIERAKAPSITFFKDIFHEKMGILRSIYHQNDTGFSKNAGKQSLANAVAAIAMLREYKARHWISRIVDNILITGEIIYLDSKKNLVEDQLLGIKELTDKIKINENEYKPIIEETTVIGRLNSVAFESLDLTGALEEFFTDHDAGMYDIYQIGALRGHITFFD